MKSQEPSGTSIRKAGLGAGKIVQVVKYLTLKHKGQNMNSIPNIHIKSQTCGSESRINPGVFRFLA